MTLPELHREIEPHLEKIEKILPKEYRLTLIARHTTNPKAEIILSLDNLPEVVKTLQKHTPHPNKEE